MSQASVFGLTCSAAEYKFQLSAAATFWLAALLVDLESLDLAQTTSNWLASTKKKKTKHTKKEVGLAPLYHFETTVFHRFGPSDSEFRNEKVLGNIHIPSSWKSFVSQLFLKIAMW